MPKPDYKMSPRKQLASGKVKKKMSDKKKKKGKKY